MVYSRSFKIAFKWLRKNEVLFQVTSVLPKNEEDKVMCTLKNSNEIDQQNESVAQNSTCLLLNSTHT